MTIGNIGQLLLTDKGRQVAQNIYDRHCFIKECLMFLGVSPETAEADACRLEHVLSEETLTCMKAHYENTCPNQNHKIISKFLLTAYEKRDRMYP